MSWLELEDARVLIVGVGGIGSACATGFAAQGARVMVADRDAVRIKEFVEVDRRKGRSPLQEVCDLTEPGAGEALVQSACDQMGGVDVVMHCVGLNDRRPVLEFTEDEWDRIISTNLKTAFVVAQAAGRRMTRQGSGRVILLSSVSGLLAHRNHAPYAASKGGLNQMMRVMAAEWAAAGVTVNAIAPGYVETPLTASYLTRPGIRDGLTSLVPAGRLGAPEELVGTALFLASPHAGFITGHVMYVDGGRTLV